MDISYRIRKVPIWDEEIKDKKDYTYERLRDFDPTVMPEPENKCDLMRQRVKVVRD